ncbi:MAG: hypothetical protein WB760_34290 [Xanthobacteraceae bacterium]
MPHILVSKQGALEQPHELVEFDNLWNSLETLCRTRFYEFLADRSMAKIPDGFLRDSPVRFLTESVNQGQVDCESIEYTQRVNELSAFSKVFATNFAITYPFYMPSDERGRKRIKSSFDYYVLGAMSLIGDLRMENRRYQQAVNSYNLAPKQ